VHGVSTFSLIMLAYLSCTVFLVLVAGRRRDDHLLHRRTLLAAYLRDHRHFGVLHRELADIVEVMSLAPPQHSQLNPFDSSAVPDFTSGSSRWPSARDLQHDGMQQKQGFNSAARAPHESRMGAVLGEWRSYARNLMLLVLGICAMTF